MDIANKARPLQPHGMALVVCDPVPKGTSKKILHALRLTKEPFVVPENCSRLTILTTPHALLLASKQIDIQYQRQNSAAWDMALQIFTGLDPGGHPGETFGLKLLRRCLKPKSYHYISFTTHFRSCLSALIADTRNIVHSIGPYTKPSPSYVATHAIRCVVPPHPRVWMSGNHEDKMLDASLALCKKNRPLLFACNSPPFLRILPKLHRQNFHPEWRPHGIPLHEIDLIVTTDATDITSDPTLASWWILPEQKRPPWLWLANQQPAWIHEHGSSNFYGPKFVEASHEKHHAQQANRHSQARHQIANMAYSRSIGLSPIRTLLHLPAEEYCRAAEASKIYHATERLRRHPSPPC